MSTTESGRWNIHRAGRILIAAGALDEEFVYRIGNEIEAALTVRSHSFLERPVIRLEMNQQSPEPVTATVEQSQAAPAERR